MPRCVALCALPHATPQLHRTSTGLLSEASNPPQLDNRVQQDRLQVCLPTGAPASPPPLCLQGPRPGHAVSPSSASPGLNLPEHPHSRSPCAPTAAPTSLREKREQRRHTHPPLLKPVWGQTTFQEVPNIRLFLVLHHPCSISQANTLALRANTVAYQTAGPCCCQSPGETWPEASGGRLLKPVQPWD